MEHGPFMDDFPFETSIHSFFSIAMFDYQRVYVCINIHIYIYIYIHIICVYEAIPSIALPASGRSYSDTAIIARTKLLSLRSWNIPRSKKNKDVKTSLVTVQCGPPWL